MGRKANPVEVKTCEKCGKEHTRPKSKYCSNQCGLTARWTEARKKVQSVAMKKYKQTDEGEENTHHIRKDAKVPLPVVHPDQPHLNRNQFVAGDELWTVVDGSDEDGRFESNWDHAIITFYDDKD